jgi:pyrroloquinoline quinone (PQQ) biosynthesis protein C
MPELPTITVYSDGCNLCRDTVSTMSRAAGKGADHVEERRIDNTPRSVVEALGIKATPAIVFNDTLAYVGTPTAEDASILVKRAEIDRVILQYSIPKSDAVQRFAHGKRPSEATAKALASEFYPFCVEFPLFLAAAISHLKDDETRMLLVHNLYEEHGNLIPERIHPALFRNFCQGLGLKSAALEGHDNHSPGMLAAKMMLDICREGPAVRALAALYPVELLFAPTCDLMVQGLRHLHLSPDAIDFWVLHSGKDVEHAEQLRKGLLRACESPEDWERAVGLAEDIAQMFFELFDHIARASVLSGEEQLAVYDEVKRLCSDSPAFKNHPVDHKSEAYYTSMQVGKAGPWFLRALGDSERRSLVSRFSVEHTRRLAPGFEVSEAPRVFGKSRVFYHNVEQLKQLKDFVRAAYEEEAKHAGSLHTEHIRP